MYVRVDNGNRISLGTGTHYISGDHSRPRASHLYESSSIHFGFLLCVSGSNLICTILSCSKSAGSQAPSRHWREPPIHQHSESCARRSLCQGPAGAPSLLLEIG